MVFRISITPGILLLLFIAWIVIRTVDPQMWTSCPMNGFGSGECTFTNRGIVPDRVCGKVTVKRTMNGETASTPTICSGWLLPSSSVQISFVLPDTRSVCATPYYSHQEWSDVCKFGFAEE